MITSEYLPTNTHTNLPDAEPSPGTMPVSDSDMEDYRERRKVAERATEEIQQRRREGAAALRAIQVTDEDSDPLQRTRFVEELMSDSSPNLGTGRSRLSGGNAAILTEQQYTGHRGGGTPGNALGSS